MVRPASDPRRVNPGAADVVVKVRDLGRLGSFRPGARPNPTSGAFAAANNGKSAIWALMAAM